MIFGKNSEKMAEQNKKCAVKPQEKKNLYFYDSAPNAE
jgi:hypothetical protein